MGHGDDIMATADARRVRQADLHQPRRKVILGDGKRQHWTATYEGNPHIARPDELKAGDVVNWVLNSPYQHRPYVHPWGMTKEPPEARLPYRQDFRASPGDLFFAEGERARAAAEAARLGRFVVVEPMTKGNFGNNKAWPVAHWERLAAILTGEGHTVVQMGPEGVPALPFARRVVTPSFRDAAALLAHASLIVTTDGGLHHAAAAVGTPAVVIWGARTDPRILGYPWHRNIVADVARTSCFCASWFECAHCREAMASIDPATVARAATEQLGSELGGSIWIFVPSRGRPDRLAELAASALGLARHPARVRFLVGVDRDDPAGADAYRSVAERFLPAMDLVFLDPGRSVPAIVEGMTADAGFNYLARPSDLVMALGDDVVFRTPGWDWSLDKMLCDYPDALVVGFMNDGRGRDKAEHVVATRAWIEAAGYFLPRHFEHFSADAWVEDVARRVGRRLFLEGVVAEHRHFKYGLAERDATYDMKRAPGPGGSMSERDLVRYEDGAAERAATADRIRARLAELPGMASAETAPLVPVAPPAVGAAA